MVGRLLALSFLAGVTSSMEILEKYINPCGSVYKSLPMEQRSARHVFHNLKPYVMELAHTLKASHHRNMDDYRYKETWLPEDKNIILTNNPIYNAQQLPEVHRSLLFFSYALDFTQEESMGSITREDCFFIVDTLPALIAQHQQLVCAVDAAMGQLGIEVPTIKIVSLPKEWTEPKDCVHMFFRFAEVHTKYKKFLHKLFHIAHA